MNEAIEGLDYILNEDGSINTKRGGRYLVEDGKIYRVTPQDNTTTEEKEDEVQA